MVLTLVIGASLYTAKLLIGMVVTIDPVVDCLITVVGGWLPAVMCWLAVGRARVHRLEVLLVAIGLTSQAVGDTYYVLMSAAGEDVPLPSLADIGYGVFYLSLFAVLFSVLRAGLKSMSWPIVLDGIVGGLGAAAAIAVVLGPVLQAAFEGPRSLSALFGAAYPLLDILLAAIVLGMVATPGGYLGRGWLLLVAGMLIYTGGDMAYAELKLHSEFTVGTPLDALWVVGTTLIACWAVSRGHGRHLPTTRASKVPIQAVPAMAIAAGLTVLIVATQVRVLILAIVLAAATLALAVLPLIFRQRIRLADLTAQARTDELTGLPNRRALNSAMPSRLGVTSRPGAVLMLDLDRFKEINDGLGHDVGDDLLRQVAARLSRQLRPGDFLARMGGDEFVIHIADCSPSTAEAAALEIRDALEEVFILGKSTVQVNASIGIAFFPVHGENFSLLLRAADTAMYAAKSSRSGHAVYTEVTVPSRNAEFYSVAALNDALLTDQMVLHFQPKIELGTGRIRGVEALVRWNHPSLGLLQPDAFLNRFEEAGLMPALTTAVLTKALEQAAEWGAQHRNLSVAVNFSASSVMDPRLATQVASLCSRLGIPPSVLVVEITEEALVADRKRASAVLAKLRDMGVKVAVDDFGKGYSSLAYLRELPIDELKLDKSFILTMREDARATALVVSTIDLAHSLGFEMTAEGVEDAEAYKALKGYGCDLAQGYFMWRPVPAHDLEPLFSGGTMQAGSKRTR